ncbi:MAG: ATP-binding protein [Planctomycetes bacterium]|nr:ATP-binding protein [Planctomycetota bacterium]
MSQWAWNEIERRFRASQISRSRKLSAFFDAYLKLNRDDTDARAWLQDLLIEAEHRALTDPHYHPTIDEDIHLGAIWLGEELENGTPVKVDFAGPGAGPNAVQHGMAVGPTGQGKTNFLAMLVLQACVQCRCLVFARNASFRRLLPQPAREFIHVVKLDELALNPVAPSWAKDAPPDVLRSEHRRATQIFCEAWARCYKRHDSVLLLMRIIEHLVKDFGSLDQPSPRWPTFSDILNFIQSSAYRDKFGRSPHTDSLLLTLKAWEVNGRGVFDAAQGMKISELLGSHLLIELDGFSDVADATLVIDFLLGSLWAAHSFSKSELATSRTLLVFDDLQDLLVRGSWFERVIRVARHAGWHGFFSVQSPAVVSPEVLSNISAFLFTGNLSAHADFEVALSSLGIPVRDPIAAELQKGQQGKAVVRLSGGAYQSPILIRVPCLPSTPYDEGERWRRSRAWLDAVTPKPPSSEQPASPESPPKSEADKAVEVMAEAFVRSANEHWTQPMEFHFAACRAHEGSVKKSVATHAQARGWIMLLKENQVINANARRIQLVTITPLALQTFGLKPPDDLSTCRGKLSTRYYQTTVSKAVRGLQGIADVTLEGALGSSLKKVDVVARYHDGKAAAIEFASSANADYEIHNARILAECGEQLRVSLVIAETKATADKLRKLLDGLPTRVTSYAEFINSPARYL